ncbi:hypothetical protein SAMN05192550_0267 [Flavobacterium glycines]|uniref:Alpha-ketoglutarate decarboxylase n=2 Tax=Flavobacterium glycines TaxID=551990 RepID=A0A1G8LRE5_9FLAO|nr:hypothetical protein SAMN05192550_0267 [Flavobacterium glycines]
MLNTSILMRKKYASIVSKSILTTILVFISTQLSAQYQNSGFKSNNDFWQKVQFGGGLGLSFGNRYTDISVSPSAIYNVNEYFAVGLGAQYTYVKQKNYYSSNLYGGSLITLFNPLPEIQLSAELEQLRVNVKGTGDYDFSRNFWNTGLFLGAGYRNGNVTIGARYNVLFKEDQGAYSDAFMPFVRFYF